MLRPIVVRHLIWKLNHLIILPFGGPLTSKAAAGSLLILQMVIKQGQLIDWIIWEINMTMCFHLCFVSSLLQQVVMLICLSCHLHLLLLPTAASVLRIHILLVILSMPADPPDRPHYSKQL